MENKRRHNGLVLFSCLLAIFMTFGFSFVGASTGEIDDSRVHMIYWDQNDIHTYWTGVTNKTGANVYKPCVGIANSDSFTCGADTYVGQYNEKSGTHSNHVHFLWSSTYSTIDYLVQ